MKTQFQPKKESEFENDSHISRKKKAVAKKVSQKNLKNKHIAYNLDDPDDVVAYERYLK
jgi:hypothetical protein